MVTVDLKCLERSKPTCPSHTLPHCKPYLPVFKLVGCPYFRMRLLGNPREHRMLMRVAMWGMPRTSRCEVDAVDDIGDMSTGRSV